MGKWCLHASSFIFIESSSKLLVIRTGIKARSSSILGRTILELLALEWQKFHTFELSQLANLDQILRVASLGWGELHKVLGQIGSKLWCPWQQNAPLTYNGCFFIRPFWKDHIWHWHIGLRCAIVALWATCSDFYGIQHGHISWVKNK